MYNFPFLHLTFYPLSLLIFLIRDAGTMWGQGGGRFSWKRTFELIYTKRCLQNIESWTSPNPVFYLLDDRGVRGFSARRLCYSWSSMTAFLAPLAPPGKGQRGRLPLLPPSSGVPVPHLADRINYEKDGKWKICLNFWKYIYISLLLKICNFLKIYRHCCSKRPIL
jgi:hypothetical protein